MGGDGDRVAGGSTTPTERVVRGGDVGAVAGAVAAVTTVTDGVTPPPRAADVGWETSTPVSMTYTAGLEPPYSS